MEQRRGTIKQPQSSPGNTGCRADTRDFRRPTNDCDCAERELEKAYTKLEQFDELEVRICFPRLTPIPAR